jgi:hypothetical protein
MVGLIDMVNAQVLSIQVTYSATSDVQIAVLHITNSRSV